MALTVTEAQDVNTVLHYVLGERDPYARRTDAEWHDQAGVAAARLADKAHRQLGAGITGDAVRRDWANVEACPWQDQPTAKEEPGR